MSENDRVDEILSNIEKLDLSLSNLPEVVRVLIQLSERYNDITGQKKKEIVTKAVVKMIDESDGCRHLEPIVLSIVPALCDTLIGVEKNGLFFRKPSCCNLS